MSVPALATLSRPIPPATRAATPVTPAALGLASKLPPQSDGSCAPPATGAGGGSVAWAAALALSAAEVMRGQRPIGQLHRWLAGDVYDDLARRANRASAHLARRGRSIQIRRVCRCEVSELVTEATVILQDAERSFAVTVRLEWRRGHWLATHLRILIPQGRAVADPANPGATSPRRPQPSRCV